VIIFGVVAEFYMESMLNNQLETGTTAKLSLGLTLLAAAVFEKLLFNQSSSSFWTFLCFFLNLSGMHWLFQKKAPDRDDLPLYATPVHMRGMSWSSLAFWKTALKQTLEHRESRRIFLYLCLNLMFMFVEMIYGWLTNSLGLISDAFHMLFDCTALFIGLVASIISNWEANQNYSYGYGRVEVLSGFTNGVFLIFIAVMVLRESLERFFHPQDINTDKLLIVSVMGLCVNLVGVFAFHDLHTHGDDDGDHGHSHGHSHAHSHGHSHDHKKEEKRSSDNVFGVYLHIIADTLGSVGVIISSLIIQVGVISLVVPLW